MPARGGGLKKTASIEFGAVFLIFQFQKRVQKSHPEYFQDGFSLSGFQLLLCF
jgi:hypothetical protein